MSRPSSFECFLYEFCLYNSNSLKIQYLGQGEANAKYTRYLPLKLDCIAVPYPTVTTTKLYSQEQEGRSQDHENEIHSIYGHHIYTHVYEIINLSAHYKENSIGIFKQSNFYGS